MIDKPSYELQCSAMLVDRNMFENENILVILGMYMLDGLNSSPQLYQKMNNSHKSKPRGMTSLPAE